jgi:hypothetical protein
MLDTDALLRLRPVSYTEKTSGKARYGFIAEEVQEIDPTMVEHAATTTVLNGHTFKAGDPISVDYQHLVAVVVHWIQKIWAHDTEQDRQIAELRAEIETLKKGSTVTTINNMCAVTK